MFSMTVSDLSTGPTWVVFVVAAIIIILSIVLITGHGSWLIAGYNTASDEEKEKYDEKKLCRVTGVCLLVAGISALLLGIFEHQLPSDFVYVFLGVIVLDVAVTIVLGNTICKK